MTTFATNTGFNSVGVAYNDETYFGLLKGFNGTSILEDKTTYLGLLKGFNAPSVDTPISLGRIEYPSGTFLQSDGIAFITNNNTGEFYTVAMIGGIFPIYLFYDGMVDFHSITITARTLGLRGSLVVDVPELGRYYTVRMEEALTMAVKDTATVVSLGNEVNTNDFIYDGECCYTEEVFALPGGQWWKNDKSSFLLKKLLNTDTIVFKLFKDGVELTTLSTATLGEYYDFELYTGYVLYWENVYSIYGPGSYQVKAELNLAGIAAGWESQIFCLTSYSDEKADKTIRIETYQTGSIIRSGYNYDELELSSGWYQSFRIKGMFGSKTPTIENDYLMSSLRSSREAIQIQSSIIYEYQLQTGLIPYSVGKVLIEDSLLANRILITDYNLYNSQIFRRAEVKPESIGETKIFSHNRNLIYNIAFTDRFNDILKRN